jgi:hypothetical protein
LVGFGALSLLAQAALSWILYSFYKSESPDSLIFFLRWGAATVAVSFAAALIAFIGGLLLRSRAAAGAPLGGSALTLALGGVALLLSGFEGVVGALFFGIIYLIGKGNPR